MKAVLLLIPLAVAECEFVSPVMSREEACAAIWWTIGAADPLTACGGDPTCALLLGSLDAVYLRSVCDGTFEDAGDTG